MKCPKCGCGLEGDRVYICDECLNEEQAILNQQADIENGDYPDGVYPAWVVE